MVAELPAAHRPAPPRRPVHGFYRAAVIKVPGSRRLLGGAIAACLVVALAITGAVMLTDAGPGPHPGTGAGSFPSRPCGLGGWSAVSQF